MAISNTPSPLSNIIAAKTYNAAWFSGSTKELQITNAIAAAVADGALYVYVPANMVPYSASAVTFNSAIQMVREGRTDIASFDLKAYGLAVDNTTDDRTALNNVVNTLIQPNGGQLDVVGIVRIGSNITIPANVTLRFIDGAYLSPDAAVIVTINGQIAPTRRKIFTTGAGTIVFGATARIDEILLQWWGAVCDGVANDTPAMVAAVAAASGSTIGVDTRGGRTLRVEGTPLLTSTVTIGFGLRLIFPGAIGQLQPPNYTYPSSYFIKGAACVGPALLITGRGFVGEGGGVVGQGGNTGDNIQLTGWGATWYNCFSLLAGQDGIRLGQNTAGGRANGFQLYSPAAIGNGRHGIFIDDFDQNTNGGSIVRPDTSYNTGDGFVIDRGGSNTLVAPLSEGNTGWGIHLLGRAANNLFLGGDAEVNSAGDIKTEATTAGLGRNAFYNINCATFTDLATDTMSYLQGVFITTDANIKHLKLPPISDTFPNASLDFAQGQTLSLINNATHAVGGANQFSGFLFISDVVATGSLAIFACGGSVTQLISASLAEYSTVAATANKINVYWVGNQLTIENKTGITRGIVIGAMRLRPVA